jgi:hypothetical protein
MPVLSNKRALSNSSSFANTSFSLLRNRRDRSGRAAPNAERETTSCHLVKFGCGSAALFRESIGYEEQPVDAPHAAYPAGAP